jgi:hypothetical protein
MKRLMGGRLSSQNTVESVNPMDSLSNLSDLMIVLAVGIMLALVMNWNVDIGATAFVSIGTGVGVEGGAGTDEALAFSGDSMEEVGSGAAAIDSGEMGRLGSVFYGEETGSYYIVVD